MLEQQEQERIRRVCVASKPELIADSSIELCIQDQEVVLSRIQDEDSKRKNKYANTTTPQPANALLSQGSIQTVDMASRSRVNVVAAPTQAEGQSSTCTYIMKCRASSPS